MRSVTWRAAALWTLLLCTARPLPAGDGTTTWLRRGQPAPYPGVLLSPEAAARAEAAIDERDALRRESAARARETTAQAALADAWREQLVIERERSADYKTGRDVADAGWQWQRRHGRARWWQGLAVGVAAGLAIDALR